MDILIFVACFTIIAIASKQIGFNFKKTGLPLISGFLFTGIIAGPYVLDLISKEAVLKLRFIDEISLAFIAFAAGGELYLKELKNRLKSIAWITSSLVIFTFCLTGTTFFLISDYIPFMKSMSVASKIGVSIIAGAILIARSPSSAIAIVNELRAKGKFTQTVLGVTVIMDVVVIILFAANTSIADGLFSGLNIDFSFLFLLIAEITVSIAIAYLISKLILIILYLPLQKSLKTVLILFLGYLVFILSLQVRKISHEIFSIEFLIEPLLICMIAGFLVANISKFRKEFLKILYDIGPIIYVAFFTLTGASLSLEVLAQTWPIAIVLFFVRGIAIFFGTFIGGIAARNPMKDNYISWMAYLTQAGVGLGLAKEVVVDFPEWGEPFATIIISVIVLNQIIGPLMFKYAIKTMKEDHTKAKNSDFQEIRDAMIFGSDGQSSALATSLISQGWNVNMAVNTINLKHEKIPDIPFHKLSELNTSELKKINCHKSSVIVTMLSDDENYKICEIAYEHFGTQTVIARLNDRNNFDRFQELSVLIVDPSTAIVSLLDHFVRSPGSASLLMGMHNNRNIMDIYVKNPNLFGLALRDLRLPLDVIIMSVKRRGVLLIPHGYTRLEAGDFVTVVGTSNSLKEVTLRFDVNKKEALKQIVEKTTPKDLLDNSMQVKIKKNIITQQPEQEPFNLLVEKSHVLDLKQPINIDNFFKLVSNTMADTLDISPLFFQDLLHKREQESTTVLSPGLAVPHIIIEGEKKFSMLLVRCKKGIEFSKSQPLVYAAFVLAGTRDKRNFHLRVLSAIAQIIIDPQFEKKWMRARSTDALKNILIGADCAE